MDSLPALHPIVLQPISSPPFQYSPDGLTFSNHRRESIADLKQWLFPKRKNAAPLNKTKDWWLAQLRLYGFNRVKASMKKPDLMEALKGALTSGLKGPPKEILQLEQKLERVFLLENAEAREKEYATLSEEERAVKYSERYLKEKFFNGVNNEKLLTLDIANQFGSSGVHHVASKLGLHSASALGPQRHRWTIIGNDKRDVLKRKSVFDKEFQDWEAEERDAKRRKVEMQRQELEVGGKGSFKDVEGEWSIECPKMDKEYRKAHRSMSIFFHNCKPSTRKIRSYDEEGFLYDDSEDDDEAEECNVTPDVSVSPILCANFKMGILEGILRSKVDLPAQCTSFPVPTVPFTWRGEETGEGEIQLDYEGDVNVGSFSFVSKTQLKGILKASLGKWSFTRCKVSKTPADTEDNWETFSEEVYERRRVGRWR